MEIIKVNNIGFYSHNNYRYSIKNSKNLQENKILFDCLFNSGLLMNVKRNDNYTILFFQAETVETYKEFLDGCEKKYGTRKINYTDALKIIWSFVQQISYLERNGYTFYRLVIENIIVIDKERFIYIGENDVIKLKEKNGIQKIGFMKPILRSGYLSPEILSLERLPSEVDYRSIYYSLACLIYFSLFNKNYETNLVVKNSDEERISEIKDDINLQIISYTDLYWFLLRNLDFNPKMRNIHFI